MTDTESIIKTLSEPMITALRMIANVPGTTVHPRTMTALRTRKLIDGAGTPTDIGREVLDAIKWGEDAQEYAESAGDATPTVPQAWVDQLVTLLDADARIVLNGGRWAVAVAPSGLRMISERIHDTAEDAILRGIAQALPPTPGQGVVRLALTDRFRQERACKVCGMTGGHKMSCRSQNRADAARYGV